MPGCWHSPPGGWQQIGTVYTVMPGCWHSHPGGWQQIATKGLVSFTLVGWPKSLGGSGGLLIDDRGDMVAYSVLEVSEQAQNKHKVLEGGLAPATSISQRTAGRK